MALEQATTSKFRLGLVPLLVAVVVLIASCSGSDEQEAGPTVSELAEQVVSTKIATSTGLGELDAACDEEIEPVVGAPFGCIATTEDGRQVLIDGVIDDTGRVEVVTRNVIRAQALPSFEAEAAQALNFKVGTNLDSDAVDCGDQPVVLGTNLVLLCAVVDPNTNEVFDLTMTMSDIEARQFSVEVGATPRSN